MSYLKTMTLEQLGQYGFDISPDDSSLAVCRLYPNLSVRHRCEKCGNWSSVTNGKCPRCFVRKNPQKPTGQYFKFYLSCCSNDNCSVRKEAMVYLASEGMDTVWLCHDGFGRYVSLKPIQEWDETDRTEFFDAINDFSVSKYGARLLCHPDSKQRSKLPKKLR